MDNEDSRQRTLASLDAFLDAQRHLLARTQADLHKLAKLRDAVAEDPEEFVQYLEEALDDPAFRMSEYKVLRVPSDIDWSLFSSQDPSVFSNLTLPGPPPLSTQLIQRSPPTSLQSFVRQAAKDVLADFKPFIPPEEKEDSPNAEDEANEERLKELVGVGVTGIGKSKNGVGGRNGRRRVGSGLRLKHENEGNEMLAAGWGVKEREKGKGKDGKCESAPQIRLRSQRVRRPTIRPDELMGSCSPIANGTTSLLGPNASDMTLTTGAGESQSRDVEMTLVGTQSTQTLQSEPSQLLPTVPTLIQTIPTAPTHPPASNHPSLRTTQTPAPTATQTQSTPVPPPTSPVTATTPGGGPKRRRGAPSETFKVPWTPEEQNHLEKLLEEIPAGEKNRWAKISKAMAGKRTPRQVASRVQKYFEKLRKFGVEPG